MCIARTTLTCGDVVLKVTICGCVGDGLEGGEAQRGTAKVGVYDDARGVDNVPQAACGSLCGEGGGTLGELGQGWCGPGTGVDSSARCFQDLAGGRCDQGSRKRRTDVVQRRFCEYAIYRGQGAQAWSDTIGLERFRMRFWHAAILPCLPELFVQRRD